MKCLEIARLKYFAPNTAGILGVTQGPQTPCREVRDSRFVSTNPPLEIPAYGSDIDMLYTCIYNMHIDVYIQDNDMLYMHFYRVKSFEQHDAFVSSDGHFVGTFSVRTDAGPVIIKCK